MIGLLLSVYALYVENKVENSPGFVAFCDINAWIACSKVSELCVAVPKTQTLMTSLPTKPLHRCFNLSMATCCACGEL